MNKREALNIKKGDRVSSTVMIRTVSRSNTWQTIKNRTINKIDIGPGRHHRVKYPLFRIGVKWYSHLHLNRHT